MRFLLFDGTFKQPVSDMTDDVLAEYLRPIAHEPLEAETEQDDTHHATGQQYELCSFKSSKCQKVDDFLLEFEGRGGKRGDRNRKQDENDLTRPADAPDCRV